MRLASFRSPVEPSAAGVVGRVETDGSVTLLPTLPPIGPLLDVDQLSTAKPGPVYGWDDLELLPASPTPQKVICVGLNYHTHVAETGRDENNYPVLFAKFASTLCAAGEPILLPEESRQMDYEAELAVVIGRPGRRIAEQDAPRHVLGYTIANDVTMRDFQYKTHQWLPGKAWDGSTPLGPTLVTADEIDPKGLGIRLRRNGEVLQDSSTDRLIFGVARLIATISEFTALSCGDVILTGTPGGVGYRRDPPVFLRDGDSLEVEIDGLGVLHSPVRDELPA